MSYIKKTIRLPEDINEGIKKYMNKEKITVQEIAIRRILMAGLDSLNNDEKENIEDKNNERMISLLVKLDIMLNSCVLPTYGVTSSDQAFSLYSSKTSNELSVMARKKMLERYPDLKNKSKK